MQQGLLTLGEGEGASMLPSSLCLLLSNPPFSPPFAPWLLRCLVLCGQRQRNALPTRVLRRTQEL